MWTQGGNGVGWLSPRSPGFATLHFKFIPVDPLRWPLIGLWIEIDLNEIGETESASADGTNVLACGPGYQAIQLCLRHNVYSQ